MRYDLFISYSRRDNQRRQVTALKAQNKSANAKRITRFTE
jgi:hypothetical protein